MGGAWLTELYKSPKYYGQELDTSNSKHNSSATTLSVIAHADMVHGGTYIASPESRPCASPVETLIVLVLPLVLALAIMTVVTAGAIVDVTSEPLGSVYVDTLAGIVDVFATPSALTFGWAFAHWVDLHVFAVWASAELQVARHEEGKSPAQKQSNDLRLQDWKTLSLSRQGCAQAGTALNWSKPNPVHVRVRHFAASVNSVFEQPKNAQSRLLGASQKQPLDRSPDGQPIDSVR